MKDGMEIAGGVAAIVTIVLVFPLVYFVLGALVGWVFSAVFPFAGQWLIDGVRMIFGLNLSLSDLPLFTATLSFLSSYVKASYTNKAK